MITLIFIVSLTVIFIFYTLDQWGLIERYETNRKKWMPEYCQWCISFWLCLLCIAVSCFCFGLTWNSLFLSLPCVTLVKIIDGIIQRYL